MTEIENVENTDTKEPMVKINREKYVPTRSASGAKSLSNGDEIAQALEGLGLEALYAIADKLIKDNEFKAKYGHLNVGMQRMNIGNRLRGFVGKRAKENEKIAAKAVEDGVEPKLKKDGLESLLKVTTPFQREAQKLAEAAAKAKAKTEEKVA